MKILDAISAGIDFAVRYLIIVLMILIPCVMVLQVGIRYIFNYPLPWPEELTRIAFVWLVFMTACAALKRGEIVSMRYIMDRLNYKLAFVLNILANILVLIFLAVAAYSGADMTLFVFHRGTPTPALEMPIWISYIALPIGCVLMGFQTIYCMLNSIFRPPEKTVISSEQESEIDAKDGICA